MLVSTSTCSVEHYNRGAELAHAVMRTLDISYALADVRAFLVNPCLCIDFAAGYMDAVTAAVER